MMQKAAPHPNRPNVALLATSSVLALAALCAPVTVDRDSSWPTAAAAYAQDGGDGGGGDGGGGDGGGGDGGDSGGDGGDSGGDAEGGSGTDGSGNGEGIDGAETSVAAAATTDDGSLIATSGPPAITAPETLPGLVPQAGPDLTAEEESALIENGWDPDPPAE